MGPDGRKVKCWSLHLHRKSGYRENKASKGKDLIEKIVAIGTIDDSGGLAKASVGTEIQDSHLFRVVERRWGT